MEENKKIVQEGIVTQYNNYYGTIINNLGEEYDFLNRDIENYDLKKGDCVTFFAEINKKDDIDFCIARYVRKKTK